MLLENFEQKVVQIWIMKKRCMTDVWICKERGSVKSVCLGLVNSQFLQHLFLIHNFTGHIRSPPMVTVRSSGAWVSRRFQSLVNFALFSICLVKVLILLPGLSKSLHIKKKKNLHIICHSGIGLFMILSWVWWPLPVIPSLEKQKQEGQKFKFIFRNVLSWSPAWAT